MTDLEDDGPNWRAVELSPRRYGAYLLKRSVEYADAFEVMDVERRPRLIYAGYHLLFHSAELALKAYLSSNDYSQERLRRFSHRLAASYNAAKTCALPVVCNLDDLVRHGDEMNGEAHSLRYPDEILLSAPRPGECLAVIRELIAMIEPGIKQRALSALLRERSAYSISANRASAVKTG